MNEHNRQICINRIMSKSGLSKIEAQEVLAHVADLGANKILALPEEQLRDAIIQDARNTAAQIFDEAVKKKKELLANTAKMVESEQRIVASERRGQRIDKALADDINRTAGRADAHEMMLNRPITGLTSARPDILKLLNKDNNFNMKVTEEMQAPGTHAHDKDVIATADAYRQVYDNSRQALVDAGADIGKIENYYPHKIRRDKVRVAGFESFHSALKDDLDWDATFDWWKEVPAAEKINAMRKVADEIWHNIMIGKDSSEIKIDVNYKRRGGRVSRGLEHSRVLQYKSLKHWQDFNQQFGDIRVKEAAQGHVKNAAAKIALMERYGTNPEATLQNVVKRQLDKRSDEVAPFNRREANTGDEALKRRDILKKQNFTTGEGVAGRTYAELSGRLSIPEMPTLAAVGSVGRSLQTVSKLGGVVLSSLPDLVTAVVHGVNKFGDGWGASWSRLINNVMDGIPQDIRPQVAEITAGFSEAMRADLMSRFDAQTAGDRLQRWTQTLFKWSGTTWWTDGVKRLSAMNISKTLGENASTKFADLTPATRATLSHYEISAAEWDEIAGALTVASEKGDKYLLPSKARALDDKVLDRLLKDEYLAPDLAPEIVVEARRKLARELEVKFADLFAAEVNTAVLTPDNKTMAALHFGQKRGTAGGELLRSAMQFKSYPIMMVNRIILPMLKGMPGKSRGGALADTAFFIAQSTALGFVSVELKRLAAGEKPAFMSKDIDISELITASFLQGGGAGLYGDFLLGKFNRFGGDMLHNLAGPTLSEASKFGMLITETYKGDGSKAAWFNQVKGNVPFINLWYTKALLNHTVLYDIQEYFTPGSLRRMERKKRQDTGREFMFQPSENRVRWLTD